MRAPATEVAAQSHGAAIHTCASTAARALASPNHWKELTRPPRQRSARWPHVSLRLLPSSDTLWVRHTAWRRRRLKQRWSAACWLREPVCERPPSSILPSRCCYPIRSPEGRACVIYRNASRHGGLVRNASRHGGKLKVRASYPTDTLHTPTRGDWHFATSTRDIWAPR